MVSRQLNIESTTSDGNIPSSNSLPLYSSRSVSSVYDAVRRERKAHTMAPSTRILKPNSTIKANMFANIAAPSGSQTSKSSHLTRTLSNNVLNFDSQSAVRVNDDCNDSIEQHNGDDNDDDAPIIVKVRYDPETGAPPSEDAIRQAVNNKLSGPFGQKLTSDPIVLDFINHPIRAEIPQVPVRSEQLYFSHPNLSASVPINCPRQKIPVAQQQHLKQQDLKSQQQQQQTQIRQEQQQQLELRQKQQQQMRLQQMQQKLQQQMQQQQQLRQRQEHLLQQQRYKQQLQRFFEHQQQKKQRQLYMQQQQIRQQQYQQLLQRRQELHQRQPHYQQEQKNSSLPPIGPRPQRVMSYDRTVPLNRPIPAFLGKSNIRPTPSIPISFRNSEKTSTISKQRLPDQGISSTLSSVSLPIGFILSYFFLTNQLIIGIIDCFVI